MSSWKIYRGVYMYKTEMMEQILQSPMAQKIIQEVSPIYGEAYTVLWIYQVIGTVLDSMEDWSESLSLQVVPQTATWSLPYWEEQYGIVSNPDWSNERRRQNILNKSRNRAPMNPKKVEDIISVAAGADARIEELTGKNHFTVYISAREDMVDEDFVRKELDTVKPAHLIYDIFYEQYVDATYYVGGAIQTAKEITLIQY